MNVVWRLSALVALATLAACARNPASGGPHDTTATTAPAGAAQSVEGKRTMAREANGNGRALPLVTVYKSPRCDCCEM